MSTPPGPDSLRFDDEVVVVTGAARGIGRATALAFARLGARVAVCDKLAAELDDVAAELSDLHALVTARLMDVRDAEQVRGLRDEIAGITAGRVDVLINNAGGGFKASFLETSSRGEAALIAENFTQITSCLREFVPLMGDGARIVNVTSIEAHRAGPGFGIYSAMKAAVESLTKTLALELAEARIRVNAVAPDMIPTPGDADLAAAVGMSDHGSYDQPWPDGGTPDDVAGVIVFLASGLARFVTGTIVHVDGGTHAASGWRRGPAGGWLL